MHELCWIPGSLLDLLPCRERTGRRGVLALLVFAACAGSAFAQQNNMAVVQLPTYSFFSVATTVSVPDRGGAYLGGVGRAQAGRSRFGSPLFPAQGALGSSRNVGGLSVSADIHDLRELDRALLSPTAHEPIALGELGRRLAGAQNNVGSAGRTHIADLRQHAVAAAPQQDDAATWFERGKQAEATGKVSVAKIHYQMAVRRASGPLKIEIRMRLDALGVRVAGRN